MPWNLLVLSTTRNLPSSPIPTNVLHIQHDRRSADVLRKRTGMLEVSMSIFVVVVFMRFRMAFREGVTANRCFDTHLNVDDPEVGAIYMPGSVPLVLS